VINGSILTLGADLSVTGSVMVEGNNTYLSAQGHRITALGLFLGYFAYSTAELANRGDLAVTDLYVGHRNFNLTSTDQVTNFTLRSGGTSLGSGVAVQRLYLQGGATAATSAVGNITHSVLVTSGSTLTLGADLNVIEYVSLEGDNSTINAQGHKITASSLGLIGTNLRLLNDGAITVNGPLGLAGSAQLELRDGNDSARRLLLSEDSRLRIKSAATGFTLTGITADDLLFNGTSTLTLELDGSQPGWVFRWANPAGGDHIADLNALIDQDSIVFSVTNGGEYTLVSRDGYTYVVQPVPEPGLILLLAAPVAVGLCRRRQVPGT
jgi:hypothetical protein